jgi:hypothetical protein
MNAAELQDRIHEFALAIGQFSANRSGRTPAEFTSWFWATAEAIAAEAGPELEECVRQRISDLADGALDAGLFGRDREESLPFPG